MKISILALAAASVVDVATSEPSNRLASGVLAGEGDETEFVADTRGDAAQLRVLGARPGAEEESHVAAVMEHLADVANHREASSFYEDDETDALDKRRLEKRDKNRRRRMGGKRLKLFCDEKFRWQDERKCHNYCLEVDGDVEEGDEIRLAECSNRAHQQRWRMDGRVLRPAGDRKLCVKGTKLKRCDDEVELIGGSKFEIHSKKNGKWCLTNPHEPKVRELVDFRECRRARNSHTNLWKFA